MHCIETIDWLYRRNRLSLALVNREMDGATVLYGSDESSDSAAMVDLLREFGVDFQYRAVNRDPVAMREWEQLDGEQVPLLRMGINSIVRGFDCIKVQQLIGWVGC
jgi:predicted SpoU family rRNA methylase